MTMNHKIWKFLLLATVSIGLYGCEESKASLQSRLRSVESEMMSIQAQASALNSRNTEANAAAFVGGMAYGYGVSSGDSQLSRNGADVIGQAARESSDTDNQMRELNQRWSQLEAEREVILQKLK